MTFDVLTIGDPTIDTLVRIHDAHLALRVRPEHTELCIDYADKIAVDQLTRTPGGNSINAAFAAARLGMRTAVYAVAGDDADGRSIREDLQAAGVDTSLMVLDAKESTNASIALVFRGERTLFVWHQPRAYRLPPLPETAWIYATSVGPAGPAVAHLHSELLSELARHPRTRLAFSPGTHQLRMGAKALAPLLQASELILLNREEAVELTCQRDGDTKNLLLAVAALGPRAVVMTDGVKGSFAYDRRRFLKAGIFSIPVVDRTGAGDAYGATVVSALHAGQDLALAMAWATVQAAFVVNAEGATRGLVGTRRLQQVTREHPGLVAHALT